MNRRDVLGSVSGLVALGSSVALADEATPRAAQGQGGQTPFIATHDRINLFYRDWGQGAPVLFVAPWGLHSDWWEYQMAHLAEHGLRCISYDRRGHGRSTEALAGYDFDTLADDMHAVLERLDLRGVTLVGHSMGSGEIVRYLSRHGARRVARVVLVAPITPLIVKTPDNPDGVDPALLEKGRQALRRDRPNIIASAAPGFFGAPRNTVSTEMVQWWTNMLLACPLKVLLELQRAFTETDFRADVRAIALPTLIIHGDNDVSAPLALTGRKTASLIRGSELRIYEGAAHGLPMTHMTRLNEDLLTFIRG